MCEESSESRVNAAAIRLLDEIYELAESSSLTGALTSGAKRAVRRYNAVVTQLEQEGTIPKGMFEPLPDDVDFGELGVEARLLRSQLSEHRHSGHAGHRASPDVSMLVRLAPFVEPSDLRDLVRSHLSGHGRIGPDVIEQLAPFLESGTLSELVKHYLKEERPASPRAPEAPAPPTPEDRRLAAVEQEASPVRTIDDGRLQELSDRLRALSEQLGRSDISPERRGELAVELAKLGQEQALLAQEGR